MVEQYPQGLQKKPLHVRNGPVSSARSIKDSHACLRWTGSSCAAFATYSTSVTHHEDAFVPDLEIRYLPSWECANQPLPHAKISAGSQRSVGLCLVLTLL